jgi:hypothetical protein
MEVNVSFGEGIRYIRREFEDGKILSDEAAKGNSARCFTLQNGPELT